MLATTARRLFSTQAKTQQYFLVNYQYVEDAYYKRSNSHPLSQTVQFPTEMHTRHT